MNTEDKIIAYMNGYRKFYESDEEFRKHILSGEVTFSLEWVKELLDDKKNLYSFN